ncbi:hypothetical protein GCM10007852_37920 [Agaribacter marinus]|uniref:Serine acetyltransferase n=2 Tax=Agaribacter marinus TaxID=1431249 RepID=A0AA37T2Q1_9ALTE|nr:hypothetical protein GCM10007852_37920 [Agaribacter marinus]
MLRKLEFYTNSKTGITQKIFKFFYLVRFKRISKKLGFSIPINTIGPGLCLPHYGNIVINPKAKIGKNCKIHVGVNVGASYDNSNDVPELGDECYIAPGAKLYGKIKIANGTKIGANAVVNKSSSVENGVLVGVPAKLISPKS